MELETRKKLITLTNPEGVTFEQVIESLKEMSTKSQNADAADEITRCSTGLNLLRSFWLCTLSMQAVVGRGGRDQTVPTQIYRDLFRCTDETSNPVFKTDA